MEANLTLHEALVTVHKRWGCLVVLPANAARKVQAAAKVSDWWWSTTSMRYACVS